MVVSKDTTGFTIVLNKRAPSNLRFSWIALGVKDAAVFESLGEGLKFFSEPAPEPAPPALEPTSESTPVAESTQ
jgi:hypothetical protein